MQKLEYQDDLGSVKLRGGFVESARSTKVAEDLTTRTIIELRCISERTGRHINPLSAYQHVQRVMVSKTRDQGGYEGMPGDRGENVALVSYVFYLLEADDWDNGISREEP